jgi:hypothetical protein
LLLLIIITMRSTQYFYDQGRWHHHAFRVSIQLTTIQEGDENTNDDRSIDKRRANKPAPSQTAMKKKKTTTQVALKKKPRKVVTTKKTKKPSERQDPQTASSETLASKSSVKSSASFYPPYMIGFSMQHPSVWTMAVQAA